MLTTGSAPEVDALRSGFRRAVGETAGVGISEAVDAVLSRGLEIAGTEESGVWITRSLNGGQKYRAWRTEFA